MAGLEAGADDYLVKLFVLAELVAREGVAAPPRPTRNVVLGTITVGPLEVDIPPAGPSTASTADLDQARIRPACGAGREHKTAVPPERNSWNCGVTPSPPTTNVVDASSSVPAAQTGGRRWP